MQRNALDRSLSMGLFARGFLPYQLAVGLLIVATTVSAGESLEEVQARIKRNGLQWTAGNTSLSDLPLEDLQTRAGIPEHELGTLPPCPHAHPFPLHKAISPPADFDWRAQKKVTVVKNQGRCGTCGAFALCAVLESSIMIYTPVTTIDLSEQHLSLCSGGSCTNVSPGKAFDYIKAYGVPDEACFPYTLPNAQSSCAASCPELAEPFLDCPGMGCHRQSGRDAQSHSRCADCGFHGSL